MSSQQDDAFPAAGAAPADHEAARLAHYDDQTAAVRAMVALDAGQMGSWRWDITKGTVTGDPFVADLLNLDKDAQPWPIDSVFSSMHPDDVPRVQAEVDKTLAGSDLYEVEFRKTMVDPKTGQEFLRWLGARGQVTMRDADGGSLEMVGVNWDVTAKKAHEERLAMLAGEMDHRVKNAFAVIRALINLGERVPGDKKNFAETLRAQVQAMADAHALSARLARSTQTPASPVPIVDILVSALAPWLEEGKTASASGARVTATIEADDGITVAPHDVSAVAMLAYELATNATKYGPLGEIGGTLLVEATQSEADGILVRWTETSQSKAIERAAEEEEEDGEEVGFGSMLIQHCVATLRGRMKREITPKGLHFELQIPVYDDEATG